MYKTYLLLGSNMGVPADQLSRAKRYITQKIGNIILESSCYETAPWGISKQPDFINQVVLVNTKLPAESVMHIILQIENEMGRIRSKKNGPRIIDIDILFYDNIILDTPVLTVPHPFLQARRFTLVPLNEISPELIHPVLKKTIKILLQQCTDTLIVKKIPKAV